MASIEHRASSDAVLYPWLNGSGPTAHSGYRAPANLTAYTTTTTKRIDASVELTVTLHHYHFEAPTLPAGNYSVVAHLGDQRWARPELFRASVCAARTLNVPGQPRVTLSLQ